VVDFRLPVWGATVYHNMPSTDGVWNRSFNAIDEETALRETRRLFREDGLEEIFILRIELFPLEVIGEEGEDGSS
jgi:hypothetical protein